MLIGPGRRNPVAESLKRILIVEDEAHTATLMYRVLNDVFGPGYQASICPLGPLALTRLEKETFDLIVTDLYMPGMSGLELINKVREAGLQTPILVVTAYGTPEVQARIRNLGAGFMAKPFDLRDFMDAVRQLLDQGPLQGINGTSS
jgi:DNA-binding response OmpR family regulator